MESIRIFDIEIHCITQDAAVQKLIQVCQSQRSTPYLVFTPNPEILVYARRHSGFHNILNQANLLLPDGQGVVWASRKKIQERVAGSDVLPHLLQYANDQKLSVAIVISSDGLSSVTEVKSKIQTVYPHCQLHVTTDALPDTTLDMIFVGLGSPKQEMWAQTMSTKLPHTKLIMTVGGAIDFITGKQTRAPLFFQRFGLEWLWRLLCQPARLKRIFTAVVIFPVFLAIDRFLKPAL